jgi:pyruvate/2-oxoglutarate dehydrogenase complex dihydrolipoamide dehydrogenase (E3) component
MAHSFDAIIIGTGQAGPPLAARLAAAGHKVAIIERGDFGGTCVNTGCIPTKTLIASAYAAQLARRGGEYGVQIPASITVDMKLVKSRKDGVVGKSRHAVEKWMSEAVNIAVFRGQARFESAHAVRVNDTRLESDRIFINVGGRPSVPEMPGVHEVPYWTSSSMMDVDFVPPHLIVVGGSYIGLEFAQMYRRFGSEVTIVEKGARLIAREDEDVTNAIQDILNKEGIGVRLNAECITLRKEGGGVAVGLECRETDKSVSGTHVLLAVGRSPNTDDLGLDKAGISTDQRGYIEVDDELRTNVPGIWALGDCNGRGAFTHTAYNDYEIVAANLLDHDPRKVSDRITTYALFIDPPLGRAGMTENEVRKSGRKALVAVRPMTRVGRAVEKGETQGFMKALVDADTKQILGAAILGLTGDEVIHTLLDVMYARAPYTTVARAMHIHPTVSELLPTLLQDLRPLA